MACQKFLLSWVGSGNGGLVVFYRDSEVSLVDAVAASCAVPVVWPSVTIKGRRYMDGGMRSGTNADLAVGYSRVLVLVPLPLPDNIPPVLGSNLQIEKALLESKGSQVRVISAGQAAITAMGANVLDPANRAASATAGLEQGEGLVETIREFWSDR
jgi:NTE family protein